MNERRATLERRSRRRRLGRSCRRPTVPHDAGIERGFGERGADRTSDGVRARGARREFEEFVAKVPTKSRALGCTPQGAVVGRRNRSRVLGEARCRRVVATGQRSSARSVQRVPLPPRALMRPRSGPTRCDPQASGRQGYGDICSTLANPSVSNSSVSGSSVMEARVGGFDQGNLWRRRVWFPRPNSAEQRLCLRLSRSAEERLEARETLAVEPQHVVSG